MRGQAMAAPALEVGALFVAIQMISAGAMQVADDAMEAGELAPVALAALYDMQACQAQLIEAYLLRLYNFAGLRPQWSG